MAFVGPKIIEQMVLQADFYRGLFVNRSDQARILRELLPTIKDARSKKMAVEDIQHLTSEANRFNDRAIEIDRLIVLTKKGRP